MAAVTIEIIYQGVMEGNAEIVAEFVPKMVEDGHGAQDVLNQGMIAALEEIGEQFSKGEIFVPEMLMSARAVKGVLDYLKPHLMESGAKPAGTLVIGTVEGDIHDIGKSLVGMMMEGGGFTVVDLGVDVDSEAFIDAAMEHDADIVGLSGLLSTSMMAMMKIVSDINEAVAEGKLHCKTIVGGAPVNQEFADTIGASGYGEDAPVSVRMAKKLLGDQQEISVAS